MCSPDVGIHASIDSNTRIDNGRYQCSHLVSCIKLDQNISDAYLSISWISAVLGSDYPQICLGFATIARKGARYFKSAVGSVLEGLSEEERADIHLILSIAHTDPSQHPAYYESWFHKVADQVLVYDKENVDVEHIRG